jgi:MFS family permease
VSEQRRSFFIIVVASFFFFLNFSELILLPKYIVHLGLSPADIGLVMGAFSITVLITLPLAGVFSERLSRKCVFIAGAGLLCLATPFYALVQGMGPLIFGLRVIQGAGFAGAFGILGAFVFDIAAPGSRRYLLGILTAVNISTHAIGPALGEYIIHARGYPLFFYTAAGLGFVGVIAGFFLPGSARAERIPLLPLAQGLPHMAAALVLGTVFGSQVVFVPPFLLTRGIDNSSLFFVSFVAGSLMVWSFLHKPLRGAGDVQAWVISLILMLVFPLAVPFFEGRGSLIALALAFGIGYGYLYPTLNAYLLDIYPDTRSLANSLFVWSFNLGMLVSSLGFGAVSAAWGYETAFFVSGILGLSMLALILRLR